MTLAAEATGAAVPAAGGRIRARALPAAGSRARERWALAGVLAVAAALRVIGLAAMPLNPFYDAAVRSMGTSWHAFLTGALDPSGQLAIDKPPLDLWLQVASTHVLGFGPVGLLVPSALGGVAGVALLYDLVRTLAGARSALVAAAALAVLPVDVITSRSDTMDAVMGALILGALAVTARGARGGRASRAVIGGALLGLAFEVKLFEALLGLVPLAVLWWAGAAPRLSRARRAAGLAGALAACVVVGVAWLAAVTVLVPAAHRPWAFGSSDGSAWRATFVYDGWQRLHAAHAGPAAPAAGAHHGTIPAPPGPARLLAAQDGLGPRLGIELAAAWVLLIAVLALRAWRPLETTGRAGLAALASWLALGTVLFSVQAAFRPRYAEAFAGAVAGVLGMCAVLVADALRGRARARPAAALAAVAVLAASGGVATAAVSRRVEDAGTLGALPAARLQPLSAYLRAHRDGARYEAADVAVTKAAALIAADGAPQLMLNADAGRPLVGPHALARAVRRGDVRFAVVDSACRVRPSDGCSATAAWIRAHGVDVSRAAGQPRPGVVYRLGGVPVATASWPQGAGGRARSTRGRHHGR